MKVDREKVLRGLECCTSGPDCESCPYDVCGEDELTCMVDNLMRDALEFIREVCV